MYILKRLFFSTMALTVLIFASLSGICAAESAEVEILANPRSYEYRDGSGKNWGFSVDLFDEVRAQASSYELDFGYVGLSQQNIVSLLEDESQWRKYWFYIDISPAWQVCYDYELTKLNGTIQEDLQGDKDMFVRNVKTERIYDEEPLRVFPKPYMMVNSMDVFLDYENARNSATQSETPDVRQWILEALVYVGELSEQEIETHIQTTEVSFDVLLYRDKRMYSNNITIELNEARQRASNEENGLKIKALTFQQIFPDFEELDEVEIVMFSHIPDDVLQSAVTHPEQYVWFGLESEYEKDMAQGVCNIKFFAKENVGNVWSFPIASFYEDLFAESIWENGRGSLKKIGFLIAVPDMEQSIEKILKEMRLGVSFSTSFAGELYWGNSESIGVGYAGAPSVVDVEMSEVKFVTGENAEL